MAEITINNSPIHNDAIITYPYGVADSSYTCGFHTGVDFAPYGTTEKNPWLYPVKKGRVVYTNTNANNSLGVQCQILDDDGHYWRYCHMVLGSLQLKNGDIVDINTKIGRMGATGNVTGIHLHLESSTTQSWQCTTFLNPCTILGIPNIDNTIIKFNGEIGPPEPPITIIKKKKFKWVLYARKKRQLF